MSEPAIRVEKLSKQYRIGGKRERYRSLRDTLSEIMTAPFQRARKLLSGEASGATGQDEVMWALRDISFDVQHGEVIGIVGRNGAGKSTLLKVLSRITEPTEGYAKIYGRVGSLLEVGTGFHPELTGQENIYLNGAILGMGRSVIDRKFDEIVAFAEVEKFIYTPVKHYSSGMYLRLAFAVAAHLEPEILMVDEVLAVGDAAFQKKCLGKMTDVSREGRTVLFVSHNLAAVRTLCTQGVLLSQGQLIVVGNISDVLDTYVEQGFSSQTNVRWPEGKEPGTDKARIRAARIVSKDDIVGVTTGFGIEVEYMTDSPTDDIRASVLLYTSDNICVFCSGNWENLDDLPPSGNFVTSVFIPPYTLNAGRYWVNVVLVRNKGETVAKAISALDFEIIDDIAEKWREGVTKQIPGVMRPRFEWKTQDFEVEKNVQSTIGT